jgi:flagellar hook protein FlgE
MSINSALLAGVSGLIANASALGAISDNIANVNTTGYKRNQISFSDIVASSSARGRYAAGGTTAVHHRYVGQQGLVQGTNNSTDLAVTGDGMFVVTDRSNTDAQTTRLFTRAGSFSVDADGFLRNDAGLYLQGWLADDNGIITPNPADLNKLSSINVKAVGGIVTPTTQVNINANLDATQTASASKLAAYDPLTNSMAAYDPATASGTKPDYTIQVKATDSLGNTHQLGMSFMKTAVPNQWKAEIYGIPPSEIVSGAGLAPGQIAAGLVTFLPDGTLDVNPANTTLFADPSNPSIDLGASNAAAPAAGAVNWGAALGINGQTISFGLGGSNGSFKQLASANAVRTIIDNGVGVGSINGVQISSEGFINATFDNGQTRRLGQVAVATFPNPDGLKAVSGNAYGSSIESGDLTLNEPTQGGAGKITASALEASTVDLSSEFTGLITTQRAYSASSRIITTADQMLEELINLKR